MKLIESMKLVLVKSVINYMERNNLTYNDFQSIEFKYDATIERQRRMGWYVYGFYWKDGNLESCGSAIDIDIEQLIKYNEYTNSLKDKPQRIAEDMDQYFQEYCITKERLDHFNKSFEDASKSLEPVSDASKYESNSGYIPQKSTVAK